MNHENLAAQTGADSAKNFYLIVTPGFEDLAAAELRDWLPTADFQTERGGVSLRAPLEVGLGLNRALKIPTRILIRLADYGCRDFPKLFKKMQNFPWDQWIPDSSRVEFHATSKTSRMKMKKRIEETCLDGRKSYLKKKGVDQPTLTAPLFTVFVRFEDDVAWISLDTSGEILHKRGLRPLSSEAPLRETMAASLLRFLESFGESSREIELVDPMTGGGTFLMEAALSRKKVTSRNYDFEKMTGSRPAVESANELRAVSKDPYVGFVGFDTDAKTLLAAGENLKRIGETRPLKLVTEDFFEAQPLAGEQARWCIVNPPYGERIKVEGKLSEYYERLYEAVERVIRPERSLFLLPEKVEPKKLRAPKSWKFLAELKFQNGGLPVVAVVFGRR